MVAKQKVSEIPSLLAEWHPTKNTVEPSVVSSGSERRIWWKCPKGDDHEWEAPVFSRKDQGCPVCAGRKVVVSNSLFTTHPDIVKEWHPKNSITAHEVTCGSDKKLWWKCDKGHDHEWLARVHKRVIQGCPICSGRKVAPSTALAALYPELAKEWHSRNTITPSEVTAKSGRRVWWKCTIRENHEWEAVISNRTSGTGCPKCRASKGEKLISWNLDALNIYHQPQFRFTNCRRVLSLPFDFVILPEGKSAGLIEYQGEQHYRVLNGRKDNYQKLLDRQASDQIKRDFCKSRGLQLLEIPYWKRNEISEMIAEFVENLPPRRNRL